MERSETLLLGIIGATLLIVGCFAPVLTVKGDLSYFDVAKEGALSVLALGIISFVVIAINRPFWLFATGLLSLVFEFLSFLFILVNIFIIIGGMHTFTLQWGFGVLMIGSVLLTMAGIIPIAERGISRENKASDILKMRYAKGEITKEQYEEMQKTLIK